jgi:hypothetical protein
MRAVSFRLIANNTSHIQTFLDAFAQHRNKLGLPAVSISLPAVADIGIVAERNMGESLATTLGTLLPEREVYAEVEAAIIGAASGRNIDGKSFPSMPPDPNTPEMDWQKHGMSTAMRKEYTSATDQDAVKGGDGGESFDTLEALVEGLRKKVSVMTMLHMDDISADRDLHDYGLDSLVSGELRSWIRRQVGVELSLPRIIGARNLQALAEDIFSQG